MSPVNGVLAGSTICCSEVFESLIARVNVERIEGVVGGRLERDSGAFILEWERSMVVKAWV